MLRLQQLQCSATPSTPATLRRRTQTSVSCRAAKACRNFHEARRGARKEPKETERKEQLLQCCRQHHEPRLQQLQQQPPLSPPPACLPPVLQQDVGALTTQERMRD